MVQRQIWGLEECTFTPLHYTFIQWSRHLNNESMFIVQLCDAIIRGVHVRLGNDKYVCVYSNDKYVCVYSNDKCVCVSNDKFVCIAVCQGRPGPANHPLTGRPGGRFQATPHIHDLWFVCYIRTKLKTPNNSWPVFLTSEHDHDHDHRDT